MNTNIEKIIKYHTRKFKNREYYEDLQQDCRIIVYDKLNNYNENMGAKLTTYMSTVIKREVEKNSAKYNSIISTPKNIKIEIVSNMYRTKDGYKDIYNEIEGTNLDNKKFYHNLWVAKNNLKKEQYRLVELLINGYSKREIARRLNISPQAVDDRFKVITKKLKNKWEEI